MYPYTAPYDYFYAPYTGAVYGIKIPYTESVYGAVYGDNFRRQMKVDRPYYRRVVVTMIYYSNVNLLVKVSFVNSKAISMLIDIYSGERVSSKNAQAFIISNTKEDFITVKYV